MPASSSTGPGNKPQEPTANEKGEVLYQGGRGNGEVEPPRSGPVPSLDMKVELPQRKWVSTTLPSSDGLIAGGTQIHRLKCPPVSWQGSPKKQRS